MKLNIRQLLKAIYLKLYTQGNKTISLKNEDIEKYIENLEYVLDSYNIDTKNVFVLTPVLETYDNYVYALMDIFLNGRIGYINDRYDTIIIDYPNYFVNEELERVKDYDHIINECCAVISGTKINDKSTLVLEKTSNN